MMLCFLLWLYWYISGYLRKKMKRKSLIKKSFEDFDMVIMVVIMNV